MLRRGVVLGGAAAAAAAVGTLPAYSQGQAQSQPPSQPQNLRPIFVLNSQDADVSVIDPVSFKQTRRLPTGKEPHHLYLAPDEKTLIVANATSNSLSFIDPVTATLRRTVPDILDPYHLRFSPDMQWFVTAANRLNHVDLYRWQGADAAEPFKLITRIDAPKTPSHLSIDSKSSVAYASLQDSDELMAIDLATHKPRWKIAVGRMPADLYLTADDRTLLVGMTGDRVVEAYDVSGAVPKLIKRIDTGRGAHAFRARGDKRHVFVSNRVANTISLVDTNTLSVLEHYPAPGGPDCMEMLADGRTLLVTSRWAKKLTFIDLPSKTVARQVDVGRSPHGVWTLDHAPRL
ncbi:MAG: YncE family protein [Rubrivivax sp.]|nr:YncE family protein [Rubrivivax sp.]